MVLTASDRSARRPVVAPVLGWGRPGGVSGTGLVLALAMTFATVPVAGLDVVATTSSMGMLARVVGGQDMTVTVLAPHDRDAHALQARPGMMAAVRRANLVVAVGAELEMGWLPAALAGAANPRVLPGAPGYFEAAAQVELLEAGLPADRSRGDVHPMGNPHLTLDPERMARVAEALAERLAVLDPAGARRYADNAAGFATEVALRTPRWRAQAAGAPGMVAFHKDLNYLAAFLKVPVLGYLEPVPGVPPSGRHLQSLVREFTGRRGVVVHATYQPARPGQFLGRQLGWPVHAVALEPPPGSSAADYFALLDRAVAAMAGATP